LYIKCDLFFRTHLILVGIVEGRYCPGVLVEGTLLGSGVHSETAEVLRSAETGEPWDSLVFPRLVIKSIPCSSGSSDLKVSLGPGSQTNIPKSPTTKVFPGEKRVETSVSVTESGEAAGGDPRT
jgi:hypothetical protein